MQGDLYASSSLLFIRTLYYNINSNIHTNIYFKTLYLLDLYGDPPGL